MLLAARERILSEMYVFIIVFGKRLTFLAAILIPDGGHHRFKSTVHCLRFRVESQVGDIGLHDDGVGNATAENPLSRGYVRVFPEYVHKVRLTFVRPLQFEILEHQLDLEIARISQVHTHCAGLLQTRAVATEEKTNNNSKNLSRRNGLSRHPRTRHPCYNCGIAERNWKML